jgi:hypothetical protein
MNGMDSYVLTDLAYWRDLTFTVFAVLSAFVLLIFVGVSAAAGYFSVKGLRTGRTKLAEVRPNISHVRETASRVEVGVEKGSDVVATPFIKMRGIINATRRGASTLFTGR